MVFKPREAERGGFFNTPSSEGLFNNLASRWLRLVALDLDFSLALFRPCDVVGRLEAYPGLRSPHDRPPSVRWACI